MKKFVLFAFLFLCLTSCTKEFHPEMIGIGTIEKTSDGEFYVMVDSVKYAVSHIVKDNTVIPPFQGVKVTVFDLGNGNSEIEAFYGEVTPVQAYETLREKAQSRALAIFWAVIFLGFVAGLIFLLIREG